MGNHRPSRRANQSLRPPPLVPCARSECAATGLQPRSSPSTRLGGHVDLPNVHSGFGFHGIVAMARVSRLPAMPLSLFNNRLRTLTNSSASPSMASHGTSRLSRFLLAGLCIGRSGPEWLKNGQNLVGLDIVMTTPISINSRLRRAARLCELRCPSSAHFPASICPIRPPPQNV